MLEIFEANSGDAITLTVVGGGYRWLFVQEMSDDKWFSEDPLWHDTAKERTAKVFQMAPHSNMVLKTVIFSI